MQTRLPGSSVLPVDCALICGSIKKALKYLALLITNGLGEVAEWSKALPC